MRDSNGNELSVGDRIHVRCGFEWLDGYIVNIQEGGISIANPNQNQQTMPGVTIQCTVPTPIQPGTPNPFVKKLAVPNALESQVKM